MSEKIEWLDPLFGVTPGAQASLDLVPFGGSKYGRRIYQGAFLVPNSEVTLKDGSSALACLDLSESGERGLVNATIRISDRFSGDPLAQALLFIHEFSHLTAGDDESNRTTEGRARGAVLTQLGAVLGKEQAEAVYSDVLAGHLPKDGPLPQVQIMAAAFLYREAALELIEGVRSGALPLQPLRISEQVRIVKPI